MDLFYLARPLISKYIDRVLIRGESLFKLTFQQIQALVERFSQSRLRLQLRTPDFLQLLTTSHYIRLT